MRVTVKLELEIPDPEETFQHIEWVIDDVIDANTDYVVLVTSIEMGGYHKP